jgi:deoxyribonuclease-4
MPTWNTVTSPRIGLHISISESLAMAAAKARSLGANTYQIFSSSPRMWRGSTPQPADIAKLKTLRVEYDLTPLVIHDNYLINLPAADPLVRQKSIASFRGEVQRAVAIGAEYLVAHPGSWREQTIESSIEAFAESLAKATDGVATGGLTLLLECTAGQGSTLGRTLEELALLKQAAQPRTSLPIGFCLDTCHLLAAGYDITSAEGLEEMIEQADRLLGLDSIPVIHTNDSKHPLGSHRDRHENIGKGFIGAAAFGRILQHPKLRGKAFILETPVEEDGDDLRDLEMLRSLAGSPYTSC